MIHLREMIIISSPRNGTNFYCECVRQIEGALGLFEIFNPSAVFGVREPPLLAHFAEALGHDIDGARDKRLARGGKLHFNAPAALPAIGQVGEMWDVVALMEYPSAKAFVEIATAPEVAEFGVHREAGLAGQLLIPCFPR